MTDDWEVLEEALNLAMWSDALEDFHTARDEPNERVFALAALSRRREEEERLRAELEAMGSVDLDHLINALRETFDGWVESARVILNPEQETP